MNRRDFLKTASLAAAALLVPGGTAKAAEGFPGKVYAPPGVYNKTVFYDAIVDNMDLWPAQKVILKAIYGLPLDDTRLHEFRFGHSYEDPPRKLTEAQYISLLYQHGRCNIPEVRPGHEYQETVLVIGRRGGKRHITSCAAGREINRLLDSECPQEGFNLHESEQIDLMHVHHNRDSGEETIQAIRKAVSPQRSAKHRANDQKSLLSFQTQRDLDQTGRFRHSKEARATIRARAKSYRSMGLKGGGNIMVSLDEVAFWPNHRAEEVWKAITPSLATFPGRGKAILASSPRRWKDKADRERDFFFSRYVKGFSNPDRVLCIQVPTWEINPTLPPEFYRAVQEDDPMDFAVEFGAAFSDGKMLYPPRVAHSIPLEGYMP